MDRSDVYNRLKKKIQDRSSCTYSDPLLNKYLEMFASKNIIAIDIANIDDSFEKMIIAIIILRKRFSIYCSLGNNDTKTPLALIPDARRDYLRAIFNYGIIGLIKFQEEIGILPVQEIDLNVQEIIIIGIGENVSVDTKTDLVYYDLDEIKKKSAVDSSIDKFKQLYEKYLPTLLA